MKNNKPVIELHAVIKHEEQIFDNSMPPAPIGTSLREWFAGLALSNSELMNGIEPKERIKEAIRIADELITGLASPRVPNKESMEAMSEEKMQRWDKAVSNVNETKKRQARETIPDLKTHGPSSTRSKTLIGVAVPLKTNSPQQLSIDVNSIPPPSTIRHETDAGRYHYITPPNNVDSIKLKNKT